MNWKALVQETVTSLEDLDLPLEIRLLLDPSSSFSLAIPKRLADRIKQEKGHGPLSKQFLPFLEEKRGDGESDPLSESSFRKAPHLLQKYQKRALLLTTSGCAMHCRFCFRRAFSFPKEGQNFDEEIAWLQAHDEIEEVILSGGDPLMLSDEILTKLFHALSSLSHIKTLRIHTRLPIGIPERIDDSFLKCMNQFTRQKILVLHVNHPVELDEVVEQKMHLLHQLGVLLLSQTVLLKGVNDSVSVLEELMKRCLACQILPYYLHQLDRVAGTCHFEVSKEEGKKLIHALRERLPGYAVPRYVQEMPFETSKTPIFA